MANTEYFGANSLRFLRQLKANNNREWFHANKPRFETLLRDPFLHLIGELAEPLAKISTHFRADPRPQGGSMFRIYRDTRFASDKSPYKPWLGARMFHERRREVHAPSFYLHIQPGNSFVGGGMWHPEAENVKRIRDFIVDNPAAWRKATRGKSFLSTFNLGGDSLSRPPRGYPVDHEFIDDLKRKDFVAVREISDAIVCSSQLRKAVLDGFAGVAPMIDYLCAAVDLEF